ncbi:MAG: T9SS type A sorting domain-containing protein [Prevotellaceae bacterium]|jgi:hypothetical protein|nr:T9SS type A sorting domain-containing protein [Prevotellaceae bacterium]
MKTTNLFKTLLLSAVLIVSGNCFAAECDHSDDFSISGVANYERNAGITSADGWQWYCCKHTANAAELSINGGKINSGSPYAGYIKSPVFSDGCSGINFLYRTTTCKSVKVEILQADTATWSVVFTPNAGTDIEVSIDTINIEGEFRLKISNLSDGGTGTAQLVFSIKNICITATPIVIPPHTYSLNVPKDATVFVGEKDQNVTVAGNYLKKHYVPFTEKTAVYIAETDTSKIWYYNVSKQHNYRVTRAGKAPHVGLFTPKAGTTVAIDTTLVFTDAQLSAHNAKDIDHDVNSLEGRNVADLFININAQGYLTLPLRADTAFQLIHTRNWQAIDTDVNNYFIEPDFHYTVVDENGNPNNDVITVNDKGLITPVGAGTAIVLVDYDAMLCRHTTNVVPRGTDVKTNPAFFSASWGENTAVFVMSVAQPEANVTTNMNLNAYWAQDGTDKTDGVAIDAEHDVLYFEADKGSFAYTFKPAGATQVLLATPIVSETATSYSGFRSDSVTANADGSYTVRLGFGRNIVKLVSATGATYQVITAKPVTYTVSNVTHPDEIFQPGDEVSVLFNTLYHPCNKMSGIYNMSAGIQYTGVETNFPLILGPGQYTFASRAQEYKVSIPADYEGDEFTLTNGVIKVKGFGSYYGEHRKITLQNGVAPNLNASVREAYFGALPDIHISMREDVVTPAQAIEVAETTINVYPNPFADYIIVNTQSAGNVTIYDLSGKAVLNVHLKNGNNRIDTSALPKGVYVLKQGLNTVKLVK